MTIDDYIPCSILDNQPFVGTIFEEGLLWSHLILKAYAKVSGTYDSLLQPKHIIEVMHDLTGFMISVLDTKNTFEDKFKLLQSYILENHLVSAIQ